jgi:capsid assembly protease
MRDLHVARAVWNTPWMVLPGTLRTICAVVARHMRGEPIEAEARAKFEAAESPEPRTADTVAILPLYGVIGYRMDLFMAMSGGTSIQRFARAFRQALADQSVKAILLDVDSPGGGVEGVDELSKEIFLARGQKPIVAIADPMMASAAYYIASAADEIVVMPTGSVGSIGVVTEHLDDSEAYKMAGYTSTVIAQPEFKAELWGTLSDEARARLEDLVGQYYTMFKKAVARNRNIAVTDVEKKYGEVGPGRLLTAAEALKVGMVDRIATLEETIARLVGRRGGAVSVRGEASEGAILAEAQGLRLDLLAEEVHDVQAAMAARVEGPAVVAEETSGTQPTPTTEPAISHDEPEVPVASEDGAERDREYLETLG